MAPSRFARLCKPYRPAPNLLPELVLNERGVKWWGCCAASGLMWLVLIVGAAKIGLFG